MDKGHKRKTVVSEVSFSILAHVMQYVSMRTSSALKIFVRFIYRCRQMGASMESVWNDVVGVSTSAISEMLFS